MEIKQISVFLENTRGRLSKVTQTLAQAGINLRAISIADTADFGILRFIVDKIDDAVAALSGAGFTVKLTDVIAVEIDDVPGSLAKLMEVVQVSNVNIEYLYATLENKSGKAVVIFRMENHEQGLKLIRESGLTLIESF
jgi:hypothetical protein